MDITFSAANTYFGQREHDAAPDLQALRETYCGTIGAEYMHITDPGAEALVAGAARSDPQQAQLHRRAEEAHPRPPDGRRRPRALPAHQVRRPEALLARRRRELHRLDGRADAARRRQGRAGNRHRHGPPRPPERAGQHAGQDAEGPVRRIRGKHAEDLPARRRQVPPGLLTATSRPTAARCTCRWRSTRRTWRSSTRSSRARSRRAWTAAATRSGEQVLPVLIHGDAAFAGQGVVHGNAGAGADARLLHAAARVHIVINNQIGFTTSDPRDTRSTLYCTDVVKMIEAPVLHVNGDDPEAVVLATQLALDFREAVPQGRRRRHRLLPQAGSQRAGHAGADAAADVQEDRQAPGHARSCTRKAGGQGVITADTATNGQGVPQGDGRRQAHGRPGALELSRASTRWTGRRS